MRMTADELTAALARGLTSAYLISGDETLLVSEACDAVRRRFERRMRHVAEDVALGYLLGCYPHFHHVANT